jgi:serine phosphatase RsbU (regulator of sigma subunit)
MRTNGEVEFLHVGGGVLAVSADWGYDEEAAELHPNDRILLYTDGATEVWDSEGRELGENGLVVGSCKLDTSQSEMLRTRS